MKIYSGIESLPRGNGTDEITEGCMVLEGGAFRGVYTNGVLDALMEEGINLRCTIGVSAGALNGINYVSGQIGRSARVNLKYRCDKRYVGLRPVWKNKGIVGFDFIFDTVQKLDPTDMDKFFNPEKRFVAVATEYKTGRPKYFEKGKCEDIFSAITASASMPYISLPVEVEGEKYLDGGCSDKIPYRWALEEGYKNIVLVRTKPLDFRRDGKQGRLDRIVYGKNPEFAQMLATSDERYNTCCDEIEKLKEEGRMFVISPSEKIQVSRFEKDMEKLGSLYYLGYNDAKNQIEDLKKYLSRE